MKTIQPLALAMTLALAASAAQAHVTYYGITSPDTTPAWAPSDPNYTGSLPVLWEAHIHNIAYPQPLPAYPSGGNQVTANAGDAFADNGTVVSLSVGANSWNGGTGGSLGYGLIKLTANGILSVDVGADGSGLIPAFAVYSGWGSAGYNASDTFVDGTDNPLGVTSGLTYLGGAISTDGTDAIWSSITGLAAGNYTLIVGDNNGGGGAYYATVSASPVPVPAAVWLFGSALAGLVGVGRRKVA